MDLDEALTALLRRDVTGDAEIDVAFDAPTRDWAAKRTGPALNLFLYDITEDTRRRASGQVLVRDSEGTITGRGRPPRIFTLRYLVTAWAQRAADEHRLLAAVLGALLAYDSLPADLLSEPLRASGIPCALTAGAESERSAADLWPALGGELRPAVELTVTVPFVLPEGGVAALVRESLHLRLADRST